MIQNYNLGWAIRDLIAGTYYGPSAPPTPLTVALNRRHGWLGSRPTSCTVLCQTRCRLLIHVLSRWPVRDSNLSSDSSLLTHH